MVGVWAVVALASCSAAPVQSSGQASAAHADAVLFSATYRAILNHYIEPLAADRLTMAGLQRLSTIDANLSVSRDNDRVVLRQWHDVLFEEAAPAPGDIAGWAGLTAAILDRARLYSSDVAAQPEDAVDQTVINGDLKLLDPFSRYAPPAIASERRDSRDGYGGIGVTLDGEGGAVRIAMVMPESPAATAGLTGGDRITAVDGIATASLPPEGIAEHLRGPIGSDVRLTVARDGHVDPVTVTLRRMQIVLKTVTMTHDDHIAVLRITSFNARTADNLAEQVALAHHELGGALKGLVLDLRGNPGGLVDQSVLVASMFLERGRVVSTVGRVPESNQIFDVTRDRAAESLPLVVLVNGGSASASEIVASALQDDHRAVIVGTSSYGKGTVQDVIHLPNQGELTVTWARLIPPGGYILHHHGVVPVVCTASLAAASQAQPAAATSRLALDDRGWDALRAKCPPSRIDRAVDLDVAEKLLTDPSRYAQALADEPARPFQAASIEPRR
ncbi:MAG TPA: S41 family peptidase [Stellaceae bacterium]|nr:S41 family peptidase [Stellaceae bacterium]